MRIVKENLIIIGVQLCLMGISVSLKQDVIRAGICFANAVIATIFATLVNTKREFSYGAELSVMQNFVVLHLPVIISIVIVITNVRLIK